MFHSQDVIDKPSWDEDQNEEVHPSPIQWRLCPRTKCLLCCHRNSANNSVEGDDEKSKLARSYNLGNKFIASLKPSYLLYK